MNVRRESVQTRSETGTKRREALRHTRAVCRRAKRRDCPSQPRIRAYSRSFMNNAGLFSSFGGPARQISVMQEELVERMRWISERRVLHAFNYCLTLLLI